MIVSGLKERVRGVDKSYMRKGVLTEPRGKNKKRKKKKERERGGGWGGKGKKGEKGKRGKGGKGKRGKGPLRSSPGTQVQGDLAVFASGFHL